jgi:integrase
MDAGCHDLGTACHFEASQDPRSEAIQVATAAKRRPNGAGSVRTLPSGRIQARYRGPDGVMRSAPVTFETKQDATAWLTAQQRDVDRGLWQAPQKAKAVPTLRVYAETWLATRELKPSTRAHYRTLLDQHLLPALGGLPLDRLDPAAVRAWYATLDGKKATQRAHAYSLLRAICTTAFADDLIAANPCRIRGAGSARKQHKTRTATLAELEVLVEAMPARYRAMVLLAAWCGLRFGELAELRRSDVTLRYDDGQPVAGVLHVDRAVTRVNGKMIVGDPKTEAGKRVVAVPPHLVPVLVDHLERFVPAGAAALLFPARHGEHMAPASLYRVFYPAREKAGRADLRFHDLRHTGATLAAATGATLAELMARLGHSTPQAAMRYQHAAADRDAAIAEALSGFATAKVIPLRKTAVT